MEQINSIHISKIDYRILRLSGLLAQILRGCGQARRLAEGAKLAPLGGVVVSA